jgi:hypothetical protein
LSVVLYGCETYSVTIREKHRLRAVEYRVLRRIFLLKKEEATEGLTKLNTEELDHFSLHQILLGLSSKGN